MRQMQGVVVVALKGSSGEGKERHARYNNAADEEERAAKGLPNF